MSLISNLLDGVSGLRAEDGSSGAPAPWDDFWYNPVGAGSSTGMRITPDTVKRVAAVLACVGLISRVLAAFPCGIYQEQANGGKTLAKKHRVNRLIATTPNERQTRFEWVQMMQGWLELRGNAYSEILTDQQGWPEQLLPLHPDHMAVEILQSGRLRYVYDDPVTGLTRYLVPDEVFHLRNWSDTGNVGQSTIRMAIDVFGTALAEQEYSARFFENDAVPGGTITGANFKNKQGEEEFAASWQRRFSRRNRHKVAVLTGAMKFEKMTVNPSEMQLLDARKFSRIEIASIFGVAPHLIGETEKTATYASVEQANIMFATHCLWPRVVNWEQTIWRDLVQDPKYFPKFSMAALLRGDTAARYGAYQIAVQNGWLSQNEVRILEDLNPVPDGDSYWRPMNWARLGDVATPQSGTGAVGGEGDDSPADNEGTGDAGDQQDEQQQNLARATQLERLKLLAGSAAERCVRKETSALRKLLENGLEPAAVRSFYGEHARFVSEVLRLPADQADAFCTQHAEALLHSAEPQQQLELLARAGERELAELAVA